MPVGRVDRRPWASCRKAVRRLTTVVLAATAVASLVVVPPATAQVAEGGFSDVTGGFHKAGIDALAELGLLSGTECAPGRFCPSDPMKRWTMAVWLVRTLDNAEPPAVSASRFADVDSGAWWAPHVERLAALRVTQGCKTGPLSFCPDETVNRGQMATFLWRAFDLEFAAPAGFTDIAGNFHEATIDALAGAGITVGCNTEPLRYCPGAPVTRAQMATLLARALGLIETPLPATAFATISAGLAHTCALRFSGIVRCWGDDSNGQTTVPQGTYSAVSAGSRHSCGVRTDGSVACWGDDSNGQTTVPQGTYSAVSAGSWHSCGQRSDGSIACWGANALAQGGYSGQSDAPEGTFVSVSAGLQHSCGVRTDRTVVCWGQSPFGQSEAPEGTFTTVSAGRLHSCGVRTDRTVACWGSNEWRGDYAGQAQPPSGTFSTVSAGWGHTCGLRTDRAITCWGNNYDRGGNYSGQAEAPQGTFRAVSTHAYHSCGVRTDGTIACWGANGSGQGDPPALRSLP